MKEKKCIIEKIGKKIPDPVVIFMLLYCVVLGSTYFLGGKTFEILGGDGSYITNSITNMLSNENIRWIFDNAITTNWLSFGGGVLGTILIVMLGVGIAEESGLLSVLIKKIGLKVSDKWLPLLLVFLGIMSSIATDAGYIILIPLAGLLYAGLKKNPLIGMAAAFAGVSAGFSANLIPAAPMDIIIGNNAKIFAESQGIPFVSYLGENLTPATMHYYFIFASTIVLSAVGALVTIKVIKPRLEKESYVIPDELDLSDFTVKEDENKALRFALIGLVIGFVIAIGLAIGPLSSYTNEIGEVTKPFLNNIIIIITFLFFIAGLFYGVKIKKFKTTNDVVSAMSKQMGGMGYVLVLTFFSYNFLALLSKSGLGTYITYLGATSLQSMGLSDYPILMIIGFIIVTSIINLFVGGLTSKWMLLGPIFIPMLYQVNANMTPDFVAAAYRIADSSTNIVTPLMSYAAIILVYMKKYKPEYTIANMMQLMLPYSISFMVSWVCLLITFFVFKLPLGF